MDIMWTSGHVWFGGSLVGRPRWWNGCLLVLPDTDGEDDRVRNFFLEIPLPCHNFSLLSKAQSDSFNGTSWRQFENLGSVNFCVNEFLAPVKPVMKLNWSQRKEEKHTRLCLTSSLLNCEWIVWFGQRKIMKASKLLTVCLILYVN